VTGQWRARGRLWALDGEAFLPRQGSSWHEWTLQIDQVKQGERLSAIDELLVPRERGQRRYLHLTAAASCRLRQPVGSYWRRHGKSRALHFRLSSKRFNRELAGLTRRVRA
jgi:hypothetical protein